MAKKSHSQEGAGAGREPQGGKTTMKVSLELLRKAKMVAIYKDIDMFDYIDTILRPVVERDYEQMIRDESKG